MWFRSTLAGGGYASLLFLLKPSQSVLCGVMWEACSRGGGGRKKKEKKDRTVEKRKSLQRSLHLRGFFVFVQNSIFKKKIISLLKWNHSHLYALFSIIAPMIFSV